ncbi:sporulation protein [Heliobacterium chlorum]|uniref:Sporulation protein n=1 Tax=Heliobacterium chlorum TaxID=2698 RepID=A0ABR7T1R8_HELCL|nr:sporulation protein [Heliobacterium chlorum]MBC9783953.1 sporulation protein [Heliobacterium chlorum]
MLKKLMATIGFGAAKVNLVLNGADFRIGDNVNGVVRIQPGSIDQTIKNITIHFMMEFRKEDQTYVHKVDLLKLPGLNIRAGEGLIEIPLQYRIPWHIPITRHGIHYYFTTELDIDMALDPSDKDYVRIYPDGAMETVMRSFEMIGFREKYASGELDQHGQEFEYIPTGFLAGQVEEVEVHYRHEPAGLRLYMEIDKRLRGISGFLASRLDLNEKKSSLFMPYENIAQCTGEQISATATLLQNYLQQELSVVGIQGGFGSSRGVIDNHGFHSHGYGYGHQNRGHGMGGAMAGATAGFVGGMLLEEAVDEALEGIMNEEGIDNDEGTGAGGDGFFDGFGGDDE